MQLRKYGGYVRICEDYHGQPWLTLGPHRLICMLCLLAVNLTSLILLIILNQKQSGYNFFLVHIVILIYLDIVWIAGGCINPGIVLRQDEDDEQCPKCANPDEQNPPFTNHDISITHCDQCEICIRQRGHHCQLLGGCIGQNNKIIYYFYLLGLSLWVIDVASTAPYAYYMM